jgi:hypothetical protein
MYVLSSEDRAALVETAARLGVAPDTLESLIAFESNFRPAAKNPYSSARGLIQFTDATAAGLGYRDSADLVAKHPTRAAQLRGPVAAYLTKYKPFPTVQSLHMAVFYPAARAWGAWQPFPVNVQAVNPGIKTPGDYMAQVARRLAALRRQPILIGGAGVFAILVGALVFFSYTTNRKGAGA